MFISLNLSKTALSQADFLGIVLGACTGVLQKRVRGAENSQITQKTSKLLTLPALQKKFVNIFCVFAWEFCIEKWRGFLVNFSGLRFPRNEARKIFEKLEENSEQNSGQNSGQNFEKFGELSFCNFSDLKITLKSYEFQNEPQSRNRQKIKLRKRRSFAHF